MPTQTHKTQAVCTFLLLIRPVSPLSKIERDLLAEDSAERRLLQNRNP